MALSTDLFDYSLPSHLIAQAPASRRDASRLLVVDRRTRTLEHRVFSEIGAYLKPGDTLFRNNAAVLPARLHGRRPTGGAVECFLLRAQSETSWWCLLRPGKKLPVGATFAVGGDATAVVEERAEDGVARVAFTLAPGRTVTDLANTAGDVPLPPYIERAQGDERRTTDLERYQTVYADRARQVAVAAPTAGLHFTPELLASLASAGVAFADLTLHVGLGTFKPIEAETIEAHAIHREIYEVPPETQARLFAPTGRRIAVGTTSVRSIEDTFRRLSGPANGVHLAEAGIYLYPPCAFRGVDALVTNFHQPRSTLLCLVSAFLAPGSTDGIAWLKDIYAEAIRREYRFFSYGDAMLIL